jgi:hypothetical protein
MFGRHKNNKAKPELTSTNVEYLVGHPLYPQSFYGWAEFMPDRLELKKRLKDAPEMMIPYNEITGITNSTEHRYGRREAILFLPLALIKEKHTYIIIHTFNKMINKEIGIGIDFHRAVEEAQRILYKKMESYKRNEK